MKNSKTSFYIVVFLQNVIEVLDVLMAKIAWSFRVNFPLNNVLLTRRHRHCGERVAKFRRMPGA
jgi:hypothetical protein